MAALTPTVIWMALLSVVAQAVGVSLLPKTAGLTQPLFTAAFALCFALGLGLMSRLVHAGVNLGLLIPFMSATVPLVAIAAGIFLYGEAASPLKLGMLVAACVTIGVAATLR